ncbi:hypothetical protein ACFFU9_00910 [Mariniflexile ostreae]|uniref:Lipoprotein n=1 Tax=Mariniflexile ostreae TaxID=1520892 RepID=A0ABV5F775_9FLAO
MKTIYALSLCLTLLTTYSCSKDDSPKDEITGTLSVEEGKKQLEDNTVLLLEKIDNFKDSDALEEIIELAEYLKPSNSSKSNTFKKTSLNTISNISEAQASTQGLAAFSAKQAITILSEPTLLDEFNEEKGTYEWNANTEEFERTGDSDDIIYHIHYNNGKHAIFSFTDFNTSFAGSNNNEELPTLIKANLKIDNIVVFSQEYSATFQNGQLIPVKISNTTTIADFAFTTVYTNKNNQSITQSFNFKIGSETIIGYNYTANGDFNNENGEIEDIVDHADISFEFLNAVLQVNAKDTNFDSNKSLSINEQIDLLNSNIYAELSINTKSIAKSEFYKDQITYTNYFYNTNTGQYEEREVTEDSVNVRFLFEDGTTNDFDTYIDGSFTSIENKFDTVFEAYENLFGGISLD